MYFDEDFVKSLPDDWPYAILRIKERFDRLCHRAGSEKHHTVVREAWALLKILSKKWKGLRYPIPPLPGSLNIDINVVTQFIDRLAADAEGDIERQTKAAKLKHYENVFEIALGNVFHYEFSEGDLKQIQKLVNELRKLISDTKELEEKHKQRLLSRLEKLQSELHKKVSDLDRFWGFILEASIVFGMMGENVKPIVDRIKELVSIVYPTQTRAYDLPSNLPLKLLGYSEKDKS